MRILIVSALLIVAAHACYNIPTTKNDVMIQISVEGFPEIARKVNPYVSLAELRTCVWNYVNSMQYFFDQSQNPVQNIDENSTFINEVIDLEQQDNQTIRVINLYTAPSVRIVTGQESWIWANAFTSFSLRQLRVTAYLDYSVQFAYGDAPIDINDEYDILISEVQQNGDVYTYFQPGNHTNKTENYYENVENAGRVNITDATLDESGNPESPVYDLGKFGFFNNFTMIVGSFDSSNQRLVLDNLLPQLQLLGINCYYTSNEREFINYLNSTNGIVEAHIFSASQFNYSSGISEFEFQWGVLDFVNSGKGLLLWGNDAYYNYHANSVLEFMPSGQDWYGNPINLQIGNNTFGYRELYPTNLWWSIPGTFQPHNINTGLNNFYEGQNISTVLSNSSVVFNQFGDFLVTANSSAGTPLILAKNTTNSGRVIIDCGMSRLQDNSFNITSGNARLLRNEIVWLAFNDMDQSFRATEVLQATEETSENQVKFLSSQ